MRSTIGGVMTFYVDHMWPANSVCVQTRICSKKRAMTREEFDLDMKLRSRGQLEASRAILSQKDVYFILEDFSKGRR